MIHKIVQSKSRLVFCVQSMLREMKERRGDERKERKQKTEWKNADRTWCDSCVWVPCLCVEGIFLPRSSKHEKTCLVSGKQKRGRRKMLLFTFPSLESVRERVFPLDDRRDDSAFLHFPLESWCLKEDDNDTTKGGESKGMKEMMKEWTQRKS